MTTVSLTHDEILELATTCLLSNGCDEANAAAAARTISSAERDGAVSHGLFRLPGYVASLRSGKANGKAVPRQEQLTAAAIRIDGDRGYAPLAIETAYPCSQLRPEKPALRCCSSETASTSQHSGPKSKPSPSRTWSAWPAP